MGGILGLAGAPMDFEQHFEEAQEERQYEVRWSLGMEDTSSDAVRA